MAWNDAFTSMSPIKKVVTSMVTAELASNLLGQFGPVVVRNVSPPLHEKLVNSVSNNIMLPNMQDMQPIMEDMFQSKETKKDWDEAQAKGIDARAKFMAKHATDLGLTFPASFGTALATKAFMDKVVLKSPVSTKAFFIGSGMEGMIHLGGIMFLPRLLPEQMGAIKSWVSKTLQGFGMKQENAETWAMNFTYSGIADAVGFSVNLAYMINSLKSGKGGK